MVTGRPYKLGGNVLNTGGLIENLPREACVEVPCLVDGAGVAPCYVGRLPVQLAAMNQTHVNVHLLTIEAAATKKREHIYHAAMLEPHTAAELSLDDIIRLVDDLIEAHGSWLHIRAKPYIASIRARWRRQGPPATEILLPAARKRAYFSIVGSSPALPFFI